MKDTISKARLYVLKNSKSIVLVILLLMSVFYNIKLKSELDGLMAIRNIRGTYQNENMLDPEYFVFSDGEFYRYKQFQLLDKGTYENIYDNVYIIKSHNIDEYIVYSNDEFHFYDRANDYVIKYSKISNVPTYINIDIDNYR